MRDRGTTQEVKVAVLELAREKVQVNKGQGDFGGYCKDFGIYLEYNGKTRL